MRLPVDHSRRMLLARVLMLTVAVSVLLARGAAPPATALVIAFCCLAANGVAWGVCRRTCQSYAAWAPLLDVATVAALAWAGGGTSSGLLPLFIVPAATGAWVLPPKAVASLVALALVAMGAVAPPSSLRGATDYLLIAAAMAMVTGLCVLLRCSDARAGPDLSALPTAATALRQGASALPGLGSTLARLLRADIHATVVYASDATHTTYVSPGATPEQASALRGLEPSDLAQMALRAHRPVACGRGADGGRLPEGVARALGCHSVLAVPVYLSGRPAALAILAAREPGAFTDAAVALCAFVLGTTLHASATQDAEALTQLVRWLPEPAVLIDDEGSLGERSGTGRDLLEAVPSLRGLVLAAAEAARRSGGRATVEGVEVAAGWRADALAPIPGDGRVLVRLQETPTHPLREFPIALGQAVQAPLRAVREYSSALGRSAAKDAATRERLALELVAQSQRLSRTLDELLAAHAARVTPSDLRLGEVDVAQVLRRRVQEAQADHPQASVSIECGDGMTARADGALLDHGVGALLACALSVGETLALRGAADDDTVSIDLALSVPLPPRLRGRLFDPFGGPREAGGLGLGFYLARCVMEAHGGGATLSDDGRSVRLSLPRGTPLREPTETG